MVAYNRPFGEEMEFPTNSSITSFLREWDSWTAQRRVRFLRQFVVNNERRTGAELEQQFAQAASLFFTRLTAWIRTTYLFTVDSIGRVCSGGGGGGVVG